MEIVVHDKTIGMHAFAGRVDIDRLIVGPEVERVEGYALTGLKRNVDIVWLSRAPFKSPLYKILPDWEMIRSFCAPYTDVSKNWNRKGEKEKSALMCGYLLAGVYEEEYNRALRAFYDKCIEDELPDILGCIAESGCLYDVFLACHEKKLIKNSDALRKYLNHVRSLVTDAGKKKIIDEIEQSMLFQADEKPDSRDKALLRKIRSTVSDTEVREVMTREGIDLAKLPKVLYRDRTTTASPELLAFILYGYIVKWPYINTQPVTMTRNGAADELAAELDSGDFEKMLRETGSMAFENLDGRTMRRMIPCCVFAGEQYCTEIIKHYEKWADYGQYGVNGKLAGSLVEKALLLNNSYSAMLFAEKGNRLCEYSRLRNKDEDGMRESLLSKIKSDEDFKIVRDRFMSEVRRRYRNGEPKAAAAFKRYIAGDGALSELAQGILWVYKIEAGDNSGTEFRVVKKENHGECICLNGTGYELPESGFVAVAHPAEMSDTDIGKWRAAFEQEPVLPNQFVIPAERFDIEEYDTWSTRFDGLKIRVSKLRGLADFGFVLEGQPEVFVTVSYNGKRLFKMYPETEHDISYDPVMKMEAILRVGTAKRALNDAVNTLTDYFYYELIEAGHILAEPYLDRLDLAATAHLLEASIAHGKAENTAVLLAHKNALRSRESLAADRDMKLNW